MKKGVFILLILCFIGCKEATVTFVGKSYTPEEIAEKYRINEEKIKELGVLYDLDQVCEQTKCNKPILLMFTGYACVNAIKMTEDVILEDEKIYNLLKDQYINVWVYVDDRETGKKWLDYEKANFSKNTQPLFVVMNIDKKPIGDFFEYTDDPKVFYKYLKKGIKDFENMTD